ncbi:hypothetical protein A5N15_12085 [Rothia kristinae]|uniref:tRNA dimethylallyltransferase n=1 Tax=Rothia kristinae TaxID=37923 RepID=A0A657IT33_9MICC|nr:hypothetical protein A5N15_12085 [Rothia kristinae]
MRVHRMVEAGLLQEVRDLAERGLREGRTASHALGYAQFLRVVDGETSEEEAVQETIIATRRFARRQVTWFRADPRVTWIGFTLSPRQQLDRALTLIEQGARRRPRTTGEPRADLTARAGPGARPDSPARPVLAEPALRLSDPPDRLAG